MKTSRLNKYFSQPYPYYYEGKYLLIVAGVIFIMSLLFNYLFEPFIVNRAEHKMDFFWICVVHGGVSAIVIGIFFHLISLIPNIGEKWKIRDEILALVAVLVLVGIGQFLIRDIIYNNPNNWSWKYFYEEIRNTLLVGGLFIALFLPYNFNRLYKHNYTRALSFSPGLSQTTANLEQQSVFIQTEVKADDFLLDLDRFLFAKAEKNYVELYLDKEDRYEKLLKRIAFKNLEAQLGPFPQFCKTHRSYLINLSMIESVSGNAQGYKLKLKKSQEVVPVSRSMISEFEEKIAML